MVLFAVGVDGAIEEDGGERIGARGSWAVVRSDMERGLWDSMSGIVDCIYLMTDW